MQAAHPVDYENDLGGGIVDIGHHLMDDGAHDAFLQPRIGRRCRPDGLEVRRQQTERERIDGGNGHVCIMRRDPGFDLRHMRERPVPTAKVAKIVPPRPRTTSDAGMMLRLFDSKRRGRA